ncbi:hypothetical protein Tco_1210054 [Tanacetum coccineum]
MPVGPISKPGRLLINKEPISLYVGRPVVIASVHYRFKKTNPANIVLAASMDILFLISTTLFCSEVVEFESAQSNTTAKLPILKLAQENVTSVTKMSVPVTAEEKTNKKNDVKARSLLLMALSNEHQVTFSQYTDAKTIFAAIETRFGGSKRFLPPEWNTHVVVWMNKAEIETISIDDLYNNFKIIEKSVKKSVGASSGAQNLAFMTALSTSSTNDVNTAKHAYEASTASPNVNTTSPQVSTASFSDNAVYAFMIENPNGSNLLQQDLKQIHEDDLEAMDLKWQLSLLSMRAKRFYQRIGKKIFINANNNAGYDKSKVLTGVIRQKNRFRNMALMAFSDSKVYTDKTCSKTCLKNYETLKKQCDDLIVKLNQTEFTTTTYKRGLATIEEQLITYRKNEVLFSEEVAVFKREVACKDYEINVLKSEFEKVKQEKEGIEFKIEKFDKASKDLNQLLESQITNKSKNGSGYNAVPPPHPLIYNRPKKLDLSYSSLDEFKEPEFKAYGFEVSKQKSNVVCDKKSDDSKENSDDSLVKIQVSKDTSSFVESSLNVDKETIFLVDKKVEFFKPKNHEKPVKRSVRYAEMYRSQTPKGNQRNWNGQKSNQLGSDFVMVNYNYTTKRTHPNAQRNMVPRAVLMKTGLKPFNTARTVNNAHPRSSFYSANPMSCFFKSAQSIVKRPFQPKTVLTNKRFTQKVNTAKAQAVNTARPKAVKTARQNSVVVNAVRVNQENAIKASACWVMPQQNDTGFVDSGCSRHMTRNIA